MIHIGISGPIGAGKSTLAKALHTRAIDQGFNSAIIPFAYGIRELVALEGVEHRRFEIAHKLHDWGYSFTTASTAASMIDEYMKQYPTGKEKNRRLLQSVGTEVGRHYLGEDAWIIRTQQLARKYEALDFLFTDDLRFNNEALAVDVHIAIDVSNSQMYRTRLQALGADYTYSNHESERSLTLPALFTIPAEFTDVSPLFATLERIRRLRI